MPKQNRTDRILILIALVVFLTASGLFYFDGWMWGGRRQRGQRIGVLLSHTGDVRMKYEGDLKWQRATANQDLIYNDSVYAGAGSQAKLELGQSEMIVTENTLVVLRRQDQVNFMNLSYGSLFGKVGQGEKVLIDTGSGKPIELNTTSPTQVVVRKNKRRTELEVVSGEASVKVNGKSTLVTKSARVVVDKDDAPKIENLNIRLLKPRRDQVIYSEEPTFVDFAWTWGKDRQPNVDETFKLEFSNTPAFSKLLMQKDVVGKLDASFRASDSMSLFYRVRGPRAAVSNTEIINFVRMQSPVLVKPVANSVYFAPRDGTSTVELEFSKKDDATVAYQVASDVEFKRVVVAKNIRDPKDFRDLPVGDYFLRAKSDYGSGHATRWTEAVPFKVDRKIENLQLNQTVAQRSRVVIPNHNYAPELYAGSAEKVKTYLAEHGLLQDFFPFQPGSFDELDVAVGADSLSAETFKQTSTAWPKSKLRPGHYEFRYQASRKDYNPTPWSDKKKLEITMEPPKPVGDVLYGPPDEQSVSEATWYFTPILFAHSYDVEVSNDPRLGTRLALHLDKPQVQIKLKGENYWRARARDAQGRIISEFSPIYKLKGGVPLYLAKNPPKAERKPAQAKMEAPKASSSVKIERQPEEPLVTSGWWAWIGSGEDYVNYHQASPSIGSLSDQHFRGPSKYLETGYIENNGWGGVLTFTSIPGEVIPTSGDVDNSSFNWTTVSLEAIHRTRSNFTLGDSPIYYGVRIGIQQHQLPLLFIDQDGNAALKTNQSTDASAGFLVEWTRNRWKYYWLMRYQYPLASKAEGADLFTQSPIFSFDGSIGTSYNLTRRLKAGLFWYGQWQQFSFDYSDGTSEDRGSQSLFYSNVDLRLGFDF